VACANALPFFIGVAGGNVILHRLGAAEEKLTPARLDRDTLIMTMLVFLSSLGLPREFLPAMTMARVMVSSFCTDAPLSNKVNIMLAPLYVVSHWMQSDADATVDQLVFTICGEIIITCFLAMAISNLDVKEYQLAAAALELQSKVEQVEEAERTGGAAQRLLSVTCDAFVRLTADLKIRQPSRSLSDLLMCGFSASMAATTLDGVPMIRYINAPDQQRFLDFLKESSNATNPARPLHVAMKDSSGVVFNVELFHVLVPGLRTDAHEHLVGITQESSNDRVGRAEGECPQDRFDSTSIPEAVDMRHILGYKLGADQRSLPSAAGKSQSQASRSSGSSGSRINLVQLHGLEKVNIIFDVQTLDEDFLIHSLKLTFNDGANQSVPNLMEWIKPSFRTKVFDYIQEHANASFAGRECKEPPVRGAKFLSPMAAAKSFLVGELKVASIGDLLADENSDAQSPTDESSSGTDFDMYMELELSNVFAS